jgi:hypothetical protein
MDFQVISLDLASRVPEAVVARNHPMIHLALVVLVAAVRPDKPTMAATAVTQPQIQVPAVVAVRVAAETAETAPTASYSSAGSFSNPLGTQTAARFRNGRLFFCSQTETTASRSTPCRRS